LFIEHLGVIFQASVAGISNYNIGTATYTGASGASPSLAFTFDSITQGIVHSKNGFLYVAYTYLTGGVNTITIVRRKLDGTWATALTLTTTKYKAVSLCEYGNYLAIGLAPLQFGVNSQVLLWDRDETLATVSETIDWGANVLYQIEQLDGYLIGVSLEQSIGNLSEYFYSKLVFRKYSGGGSGSIKFQEIPCTSTVNITGKQKINSRMFFGFTGSTIGGTTNDLTGIWSVGRNGENEPFGVQFDRLVNNNTVATAIKGFFFVGDYVYCDYLVGTTHTLSKTSNLPTFTANSTFQTKIFNEVPGLRNRRIPDSSTRKKLIGCTLSYEAIPTSGSVSLYYRVDGASSWTLIFTDSAVGRVVHDAVTIESSGVTLGEYYELQFQIISNGVTVTSLYFDSEVILNAPY